MFLSIERDISLYLTISPAVNTFLHMSRVLLLFRTHFLTHAHTVLPFVDTHVRGDGQCSKKTTQRRQTPPGSMLKS